MPKDNEVDEKVMPVAWQWLDTSNFRKSIPSAAIKEHWNPLYSAATVADLRAEVADLKVRLVKQRRELGAEADQADAEAKRITEVAERAMNLLERLDPIEFQKFCKSEFNRLTGADPT